MMSLLNSARTRLVVLLGAAVLATACANDVTAPVAPSRAGFQYATSPFAPSAAARSLVGVTDGTYTFRVDPKREQKLYLGQNALFIPPNAVCALGTTSYGPEHWNEDCALQSSSFVITAVVRDASSQHPSIQFQPALRFRPSRDVELYFYVPKGSDSDKRNYVMDYCNDLRVCYDESIADPSLATYFNAEYSVVYRRIKHFSGYVVDGIDGAPADSLMTPP
jgi:hypothetical protein